MQKNRSINFVCRNEPAENPEVTSTLTLPKWIRAEGSDSWRNRSGIFKKRSPAQSFD